MNFNEYTGGAWQKTQLGSTDRVNYYAIATPALTAEQGIILIPGQTAYDTLAQAQQESITNLSFGTLPFTEMAALYRITFRLASAYGSTGKARIEAITRIVGSGVSITASGVNAHSGLSGLTDPNVHPASSISVSTASFDHALSATDSTVQAALDTLDNYVEPSGGGTDQVFFENDQTVTTDYEITTGKNALTAGPITIDTGVTVTIPAGTTWTVI